jgi:hypothetical protein
VFGEQKVRETAVRLREMRIERKAALEEAERRRLELEAKREQARVDHLLGQASALHRAQEIRAYVAAVRALNSAAPEPMASTALDAWCSWALARADRIDPVMSGAYKILPEDAERYLRRQLSMTQTQLATTIGAAGKAVVYQWESGKRTPSPVSWRRIEQLRR